MAAPVQIKEIVDALQMQFDELSSYLDLETGEVHIVSHDLLALAEDLDEDDDDDDDPELELARRAAAGEGMLELPTKFDVHEWAIMQRFAGTPKSIKVRQELHRALHGRGAFRIFKEAIRRHGVEQDWYHFRDDALRQIAIDWCEANGLAWQ